MKTGQKNLPTPGEISKAAAFRDGLLRLRMKCRERPESRAAGVRQEVQAPAAAAAGTAVPAGMEAPEVQKERRAESAAPISETQRQCIWSARMI